MKAAQVARTGLLGIGGAWGGRQMVGRWFIGGFGTAAQQAAWLGRAASVAISEPGVGAHPKHLRTRAEATDSGYRILGEKAWVSNGPSAEVIVVLAITEETNGRKRYSAFLVPRGTAGLSMRDDAGVPRAAPVAALHASAGPLHGGPRCAAVPGRHRIRNHGDAIPRR